MPYPKSPRANNEGQRTTLMDVGNEDGTPNLERKHTILHFTTMRVGNENGAPNLERRSNTPTIIAMDVGNEDGTPNLEKNWTQQLS